MEEMFLPVLSHFQNGNAWTGSGGRLRYQLGPGEETLAARVWEAAAPVLGEAGKG